MPDAFISYSHKDKAFADELIHLLHSVDMKCWIDRKGLRAADVWSRELKQAIIDSDNLVFILTEDALASKYCREELAFACEQHKRIIPIIPEFSPPVDDIPTALGERHWLQWNHKDRELSVKELCGALRDEATWYRQSSRYLEAATQWEAGGSLLPRGGLESARVWLQKGAALSPGPTPLQIEFIHSSEAFHLQEAERWQALYARALSGRLAAQAQMMVSQRGSLLGVATLLAVESMSRHPSWEADQALRSCLDLLPEKLGSFRTADAKPLECSFDRRLERIAMTCGNGAVQVWNVREGSMLGTWKNTAFHGAHALHPSGRLLAVADGKSVRVCDIDRVAPDEIYPRGAVVHGIAFSGNGKYMACVGGKPTTTVWRMGQMDSCSTITNTVPMTGVSVSPGGDHFAVWNRDVLEFWSGHELEKPTVYPGHGITGAFFSHHGEYLAIVVGQFYRVRILRVDGWESVFKLDRAWHATFSWNDRAIAVSSPEWQASVWDTETRCSLGFVKHDYSVLRAALDQDGSRLATVGQDDTVRAWDISGARTREIARIIRKAPVRSIRFSRDGTELLLVGRDNRFERWSTAGYRQHLLYQHGDHVFSLALSGDGRRLATGGKEHLARIWDAGTGKLVHELQLPGPTVHIALDHTGSQVLTSGLHWGYILTSVGNNPKATRQISAGKGIFTLNQFGHEQAWKVDDYHVGLRHADGTEELLTLQAPDPLLHLTFGTAGSIYAVSQSGHYLCVSELRGGDTLGTVEQQADLNKFALSQDGRRLIMWRLGSPLDPRKSYTAQVWNVKSGSLQSSLYCESWFNSGAFDSAGQHVVTTHRDGKVRVWDTNNAEQKAVFSHDGESRSAIFTGDGEAIVSSSNDKTARCWFWRSDKLITEARTRIGRQLTEEERNQYLPDDPLEEVAAATSRRHPSSQS